MLFDYLIHNIDRWGGGFTNVRTRGEGGPLGFLDNAGGFGAGPARIGFEATRLLAGERVRRWVRCDRVASRRRLKQRARRGPGWPNASMVGTTPTGRRW